MPPAWRLADHEAHLRKALPDDDGRGVIEVGLQQVNHVGHAGCQLAQQPDGLQQRAEQDEGEGLSNSQLGQKASAKTRMPNEGVKNS